ncbi:MAG: hypothetical protein ACKERG_04175 [Candidatus Hodgkinia cicadicola]
MSEVDNSERSEKRKEMHDEIMLTPSLTANRGKLGAEGRGGGGEGMADGGGWQMGQRGRRERMGSEVREMRAWGGDGERRSERGKRRGERRGVWKEGGRVGEERWEMREGGERCEEVRGVGRARKWWRRNERGRRGGGSCVEGEGVVVWWEGGRKRRGEGEEGVTTRGRQLACKSWVHVCSLA